MTHHTPFLCTKQNTPIHRQLKQVNDQVEHAHQLGQLLQGQNVIVNLIPYNPTDVGMDYETPTDEDVTAFHQTLVLQYKLHSTVRRHHGRDINGACGQLALNRPGEGGGGGAAPADIEDLMTGGGNRKAAGGGGAVGANGAVVRRKGASTNAGGSGSGSGSGSGTEKPRVTFAPEVLAKSEEADSKAGVPSSQGGEDEEAAEGLLLKGQKRLRAVAGAVRRADPTTLILSAVAGASVAVAGVMVVLLVRGKGRGRA